MYVVTDSYGTRQTCWTWRTVLAWLAACSPDAIVTHRLTGVMLAHRSQRRLPASPCAKKR